MKCQQIATVSEGLSGREISKIAIAWQVGFSGSLETLPRSRCWETGIDLGPAIRYKQIFASFKSVEKFAAKRGGFGCSEQKVRDCFWQTKQQIVVKYFGQVLFDQNSCC